MEGQLQIGADSHLRLLEQADAGELQSLVEANRAQLSRWLPWAADQDREATLEFIGEARAQASAKEGLQTAIVVGGDIVGMVGHPCVDWSNRSSRIGYWLDEAHQGKGIVTTAVRLLVERALRVWRLNRIEIRAAPENRRSRAIPERLGFHEEGTLRRAQLVDGRYLDTVVYSILAADRTAAAGIVGLDHVQVAAPVGGEAEARAFYGDLLGLPELEKPAALRARGGVWFACGAQQLHVGTLDEFAPARKAHPALRVRGLDLDSLADRLTAAGTVVQWDDAIPDVRRFYAGDPWGNRIELLS
jgi:ribosomal-protein-serine acetyltransferase